MFSHYRTKPVTLFINNDAENVFPFIWRETITPFLLIVKQRLYVIGSILNDEYKEMMRVHDSLLKVQYYAGIYFIHYNGMNRDSAHALLNKYAFVQQIFRHTHQTILKRT